LRSRQGLHSLTSQGRQVAKIQHFVVDNLSIRNIYVLPLENLTFRRYESRSAREDAEQNKA
jgi:hypothetical protein